MNIIRTKSDSGSISFKAMMDGKVIGTCDTYATMHAPNASLSRSRAFKTLSDKNMYVSWLGVDSEYRGKYVGTRLLYHALRYYNLKGYRYVTLMDASNFSGGNNSIYKRIGLTYSVDSDGDRSNYMIGNIRHILHGKFRGMNGVSRGVNKFYRRNPIISSI
jgi:ribosomal protein S18 acetylase RimI-like enzyme